MPMIKGGYYIKARSIKDSAIAHSPPYVREIWDYLLREANHADKKYAGFILKRGQLFRSYKEIRDDLSWKVGYRTERYNENQMKMGMRYLMKQLMITLAKQPRGNVITVCNYDKFQDPGNYEATNEAPNEATNGQPMGNQRVPSINKNVKKEKKDKNYKKETYSAEFLKFWDAYPNKTGKKPSWKKWQSINSGRPPIDVLLSAIENQKKGRKWQQQIIVNPETWLNQERWDDVVDVPKESIREETVCKACGKSSGVILSSGYHPEHEPVSFSQQIQGGK